MSLFRYSLAISNISTVLVVDRLSVLYIYCAARFSSRGRPGALSQWTLAKRSVLLLLSVFLRTVLEAIIKLVSCSDPFV